MFNLREEVIQDLYDMVNNEHLCKEMQEAFTEANDFFEEQVSEEQQDSVLKYICELEHAAFFAGANMVLDFISGKEMQQHE